MAGINSALAVEIHHVSKSYAATNVLHDVSLDIQDGEFVTLLGPSGCGKTTLLMALAGFVRPTSGRLLLRGVDLAGVPPHRRDIGVVFQNYALFPHMTVERNVAYPLVVRGRPKNEVLSRVAELLAMVGLSDLAARRIDQISGGQRQRVALARALVFEPRLLLLDEPLSALDKQMRERTQIELRRLHDRLKMTTICVTHDQTEALTMSDRIAVMRSGRIMQYGSPLEIYNRPAFKFVADFIGETSFIAGTIVNGGVVAQGARLLTLSSLEVPTGAVDCWIALRPEKIRFLDTVDCRFNCFEGVVRHTVFRGDCTHVTIILSTGELLTVRGQAGTSTEKLPHPGDGVLLGIHPADTVVMFE